MKYIFDLDDQSDEYNAFPKLLELKKILPNLKVNLFTIPGKTSLELISQMLKEDWIHLIPHGLSHDSNYEFSKLTYEQAMEKILAIKHDYAYQKGFKAPGWQISVDTMKVLQDLGWWVAVQYAKGEMNGDVNGPYQPAVLPGLRFYEMMRLDPQKYISIHGHTWNCCGNGLEELWPLLIRLKKDSEFEFINNYVNESN